MDLDDITPVILTFNEEPNIARTLSQLAWAKDIVVVDSGGMDRTRQVLESTRNVRIFEHTFVNHSHQWTYAVQNTEIHTPWILVLDADLILPQKFIDEIINLNLSEDVAGYEALFQICVFGRPLARSIYPPRVILCRRDCASFYQDGHTQQLVVSGGVRRLQTPIRHDDRKSLTHWLAAQDKYAKLERDKLVAAPFLRLNGADRIRTLRVAAPIFVFLYCILCKGLMFNGFRGWYYAYQRVVAELLLSLYLIEDRLKEPESQTHRATK